MPKRKGATFLCYRRTGESKREDTDRVKQRGMARNDPEGNWLGTYQFSGSKFLHSNTLATRCEEPTHQKRP